MNTFTVTRYNGIGERPTVILIDNPIKSGITVTNTDELRLLLAQRQERIYFVADNNDNRLHGLDNWHDEIDNNEVVNRIEEYLTAKAEYEQNILELNTM